MNQATWRAWARVILAVVSSTLALGAAEAGLRAFGLAGVMTYDRSETFGYLMKPSQVVSSYGIPIRINQLGFRGPDLAERTPVGARRIAFVGDSIVYGGARLPDEQLFTAIVARRLGERGWNVERLSLAAPGWSPQNWMAYVDERGLHDADVVVLVLPECDLARRFATIANRGFDEHAPRLRVASALRWGWLWLRHSGSSDEYPFILDPAVGSAGAVEEQRQLEENLRAARSLAAICRQRSLPCLTVFLPSVPASRYAEYWPPFESIFPDALDLRPELAEARLFQDGVHLSPSGHDLVARRIAEALTVGTGGLVAVRPSMDGDNEER
jgi:lysophospholipase L1-like esterase